NAVAADARTVSRGRFLVRVDRFLDAPEIEVRQGERVLARERYRQLAPACSIALGGAGGAAGGAHGPAGGGPPRPTPPCMRGRHQSDLSLSSAGVNRANGALYVAPQQRPLVRFRSWTCNGDVNVPSVGNGRRSPWPWACICACPAAPDLRLSRRMPDGVASLL